MRSVEKASVGMLKRRTLAQVGCVLRHSHKHGLEMHEVRVQRGDLTRILSIYKITVSPTLQLPAICTLLTEWLWLWL